MPYLKLPNARHALSKVLIVCVLFVSAVVVPWKNSHAATPDKSNDSKGRAEHVEPDNVISVKDVRPGMTGYGITVLQGVKRQKFEVEVLGVTRSMTPGSAVILARLESPDLENSGLVAGMSGSPVYLEPEGEGEPRFLGAVAYGFPFARAPIAGITPAEDMRQMIGQSQGAGREAKKESTKRRNLFQENIRLQRDVMKDFQNGKVSLEKAHERILAKRLRLFGFSGERLVGRVPTNISLPHRNGRSDQMTMESLPLPMAVAGVRGGNYRKLASLIRRTGFMPVQGVASKGTSSPEELEIKAGMPIGGVYVTGDLELAGMGTATFIEGDEVAAFGHPMSNTGTSELPLATGRVQAVIPSYHRSFRLATVDRIIGTMTQDRQAGIVGKIGRTPRMFPCTLHIMGDHQATYNYRIAGYWQVAPMASFHAIMAGTLRWEGRGTGETIKGKTSIKLKDKDEPVVIENTYSGFDPTVSLHDMVLRPLSLLMPNPFAKVQVEEVDVRLEISPEVRVARIENITLESAAVQPGDVLNIRVQLQEYQGNYFWKDMSLKIPEDARPGRQIAIVVSGAQAYRMYETQLDPGFFRPAGFPELLKIVNYNPSNTKLYARAGFVRRGLRYDGKAMPDLPGSARAVLENGTAYGRVQRLMQDSTTTIDTQWVIQGTVRASVRVVQNK